MVIGIPGRSGPIIDFSIDSGGARVASLSGNDMLELWDMESGAEIASFHAEGTLTSCNLQPDGARLVTGGEDGRVYFMQLEED